MDHPEPITKRVPEIPQCRKGFTLEEARSFVDRVMQVFHNLEDMTDLRSMYETGKQLSRLYFDCHQYRVELAEYLTSLDYPTFASKMMKKLNNMGVFKNDNIWFSSFYFYNTTWNFSEILPDFATALATAGLPNLLNLNIGHQPYLDNLPSKNVYYLVKASLSIIHNIARVPGNMHCFSTDAVKSALTNQFLREEEFLRCISDLCLAYIVTDSDISLINSSNVLQCLLDHIITAKSSEKRRCHGFQVSEILSGLATLAVNDDIKSDMLNATCGLPAERITLCQIIKEAVDGALQPSPSAVAIREAEEAVRLLWSVSLDPHAGQSTSELNQQINGWLTNLMKDARLSSLPVHIIRALEAVASRLGTSSSRSIGNGSIVISFAPVNKMAAAKIAERLQTVDLPIHLIETGETDTITLADASVVGMSELYASSSTFANWRKTLDSASILVVCASEAYRLSPGCRYEVETCKPFGNFSSGDPITIQTKQIFPVCLQPKYKPSGWLGDLLTGQSVLDLSGRRDLDSGLDNLILQVQTMHGEIKHTLELMTNDRKQSLGTLSAARDSHMNHVDGFISPTRQVNNDAANLIPSGGPILGVSCTTSLGRDGSLPKEISRQARGSIFQNMPNTNLRACRSVVRPEVRTWSTSTVASWLKFRGNGQILQITGAFDGLILSQLAALRFWAPEYFARSLQSELQLSFIDGLRLIEALDELAPGAGTDDVYGPQESYEDRADAFSHISGCDNTGTR